MIEFREMRLGEIFDIEDGDRGVNYPKQNEFLDEGYCLFLNAGNVTQRGFLFSDNQFITIEKDQRLRKGKLCRNDIVVTTRGTVGNVAYYDSSVEYDNIRINSGMVILRNHKGVSNTRYLYQYLRSPIVQSLIKLYSSGSAQPQLPIRDLKRIKLSLPNLEVQNSIANALSAYDDLIENNNRRIALLEKAAQELYKEWFVRFRFPSHETVKFENGIPENWRISTVKETFDIFDTKRIPLSSMDRDKMRKVYPYYGAAELMDYVDDYIFDGIYLLLGEDGSVITPAGKPVLQYVWGRMWVNNHAHVLQGKSPYSTEYLHLMFGQMDITGIVTGAAQPKISQGRLLKKKTILPTNDLILKFDSFIQPMYKSIRQLREANRNLAKQRDLLLPRLMSGKLEV